MAVSNTISLSALEGSKRIDAEYYQPEYLKLDKKIKEFSFYLLGQIITKFSSGENLPQVEYHRAKKTYIRTQNVRPILLNGGGLTCVDPLFRNPPLVTEGDLLFVRVGEGVGNSSIATSDWANSSYSDNVIRIKIKQLDPYFVTTFLNSQVGNKYLERVKKGSARSLVSKENINLIKIFDPTPQLVEYCKNTIKEAQKLIVDSESLYSKAENLLLEKLGLKDFYPNYKLSYTANLSKAFRTLRVDAEYFQPAYEKIIERTLKKFPILLLKKIFDFRRGVFISTEYYTEQKTKSPYIRIKEISGGIGIDASQVTFINDDYPEDKTNELRENDLVIAIIGDTIGKTNKIPWELVGGFCSNNMGRLRTRPEWTSKILPEFAEILFQSFFIQSQIEKKKAPTGQPKISNNEIKTIKIPILLNDIQQKIASLVQQSNEARRKAKELLEEAKRKVEQVIEIELE